MGVHRLEVLPTVRTKRDPVYLAVGGMTGGDVVNENTNS